MRQRVLVSAGDPSGDLLLSKVIGHLFELGHEHGIEFEFKGLAGPKSESAGVKLYGRSEDVAVVGLTEVIKNLPKIFGVLGELSKLLPDSDRVICVDMPDFNFRLAKFAKKRSLAVDYLVCPQVWAWREDRLELMRSLFRRVYPVLPFEETYLRQHGIDARYLGHPIRDILPPRARKQKRDELSVPDDVFAIAVLPGSRHSELKRHLPILIDAWVLFQKQAKRRHLDKSYRAILPIARGMKRADLDALLKGRHQKLFNEWLNSREWQLHDDAWSVMQAADFGWIASGTATLEAAYYQLPHILFYRLSWLSARIIRSLTSYFSGNEGMAGLPNILLERRVIPELLQENLTPERLAIESIEFISDTIKMTNTKKQLRFIPKRLGEAGVAKRMAEDLWELWGLSQKS